MKKPILKNIIRFSFCFHQSMGNRIEEFAPSYIIEKWQKHFGDARPKPISDSQYVYMKANFSKWIERWGERSYREAADYLSIIYAINTKSFHKFDAERIRYWLPSDLVELFEKSTEGLIQDIPEYRSLHSILESDMERWLEEEQSKKDMKLLLRDIAISDLLERK